MKEMIFYYRGHLIYPYSGFNWHNKDFSICCRGGESPTIRCGDYIAVMEVAYYEQDNIVRQL